MIFHLVKSIGAGMSVLHIAEKNSIAKSVADVLSSHKKRAVFSNSLYNPVFEFQLQDKQHHFSSVRGHIFNQQLPKQCQYWSSYDNRKILFQDLPIVRVLGDQMDDVVKNLERLAKQHTELVLWLDCDRQGEAISFEVIDIIKRVNPKIKIKRARFSAVTPTDVWNAYNKLVEPNKLEADAVSYRTQIDFRAGCAFTRLQTVVFQSYFRTQESLMLSYGPCQIPTLNFVVQRYLEIKNFKTQKYWSLQMNCVIDHTKIPFHWEKKNTKSETQAQQAFARVRSSTAKQVYGIVKERKKVERKKARPYPLTTVKYQKLATDKLKISSAEAMEIAQKLYQKGYISYPRTETNTFPKTINLKQLLKRLEGSKQFGQYVKGLLDDNRFVHPKAGNQNDEAHTPIHPVLMANRDSLTEEQWRVYDLITRSFLACCSSDAIGEDFQVKADVLGEGFKASYLTITQQGYLEIYPFERWVETSFPNVPDKFVAHVSLKEDKTSPPGYLTEANLIDLMEKNEIGTDSTIHEHIENIQKRKYVIKSNNTLKPTNLGASLVQTYQQLQVVLPKCDIRRKMEEKMKLIARGQLNKEVATQESLNEMVPIYDKINSVKQIWVRTLKKYIDSNSDLKRIQIQEKSQAQVQSHDRKVSITAGKCLKCSSNAVFRFSEKLKQYFIGCSTFPKCNQIESLPSYIQSIKQSENACGKCSGKKLKIKAKISKIFDPLIRKQFEQSSSNTIQICFAPNCDRRTLLNVGQRNQKYSQKQFTCFSCHQVGHVAQNCPQKNRSSGNLAENVELQRIFKFNQTQKADRVLNESPSIAQKQAIKECPECGIKGRHPRGSDCPNVDKKRRQKKTSDEKLI